MSWLDAFRRQADPHRETAGDPHRETDAVDSGGDDIKRDDQDAIETAIARHARFTATLNPTEVDVAPEHRARLVKIAAFVAGRRGGAAPRLKFFARIPENAGVRGIAWRDGTVWIAADLSLAEAARTTIHEVLHELAPDAEHAEIWAETRRLVAELSEPAQPMTHPIDAASTPAPTNKRVAEWG